MPDKSLMSVAGAPVEKPSRYTPIATLKWIGGLQTQRSPFASLDTRYNSTYLGGKPDSLIAGSNVEISNKLTLQRRPGLVAYGASSIPSPDFFFKWQQAALASFVSIVDPNLTIYPQANLQLIIDTSTNGSSAPGNIYNYSPTSAGIIVNKSLLSQQTSFTTVVNTMYMGDGVDLYKLVGANLLAYSNNFTNAVWSNTNITITTGQTDPTGGTNASNLALTSSGSQGFVFQARTPNYTPVGSNTFTASVWMRVASATQTVSLGIVNQNGAVFRIDTPQTVTTSWALYQVTATMNSADTGVGIQITLNAGAESIFVYGAQVEVGGPATPTTITLNKPNGVYLWGMQAPSTAPSFTFTAQHGSTGKPWEPNTLYSQTNAPVTAVAAVGSLPAPVIINGTTYTVGAIYTATFAGGTSNGLQGRYFSMLPGSGGTLAASNQTLGTANLNGLPGFLCLASTSTTLTLYNTSATAQASLSGTNTATLLDTIVDTNGNLEVAYTPGKSGGSAPTWNPVMGQPTSDGLQNLIVQNNSVQVNGSSGSVAFPTTVTAGNTILVFVTTSNSVGSGIATPTLSGATLVGPISTNSTSNIGIFLYYRLSAAGTETGISFTGGGSQATWIGIAEVANQTAIDQSNTNRSVNTTSVLFSTGSVTTTNTLDILISFALANVANGTQGFSQLNIPTIPAGWQSIVNQAPTAQGSGFWNQNAAFNVLTTTSSQNPEWVITNPTTNSNDGYAGITAAFKSSVGTLVWYNLGPFGLTSTSTTNYQYGFSFVNTYTGQRSNMSPLSVSTGAFAGQAVTVTGPGMQTTPSGPYSADPQVDAIEVYRNTDGGGFWFQIPPTLMQNMSGTVTDANGNLYLANPGNANSTGTWSFIDVVPDTSLNTQIYAPIGFLNSPPPAGLNILEYWDGRVWGCVGNILYYSTAADDAALINVLQNGVSAESWEPTNVIPFDSSIVRIVATGAGLLVFTTTDVWGISGTNLSTYNPVKVLAGVGLGTYNGVVIDGSTLMLQTRDRQCLMMNVNSGVSEIGFVIGDVIENNINPLTAYLARHIKGSQDNAFYLGDGATGWFRLNPNQYGASTMGEQTPIWSPFATITGGCKALASIEVQPGIKQLLVGGTGVGPVLTRSITAFSDNGTPYTWSATIGSILLALPGLLAVCESITTEMVASESTQCAVAVLLDEIAGTFENLPTSSPTMTNDPPQLSPSISVLANRFYLSTGSVPPVCRHMQVKLSGSAVATQDEVLSLTIRGEHIGEQS